MSEDVNKDVESDEKEVEPKAKKAPTKKKDEKIVKNTIDFSPTLVEARDKTVVLGWGRMNPITIGHEKLANKIKDVAKKNRATPLLYLTHSQDPKKNPLSYNDKVMLAKKAFGPMVQKSNSKTIIKAMTELEGKFNKVILVVGQDRIKEFETLLNKYNGKDYTFDSIDVVSAGERDPDAEGVEGMSASKMRALAASGKQDEFVSGLPKNLKRIGDDVYDMVRSGMKLAEELEELELLDEAPLSIADRRKRGLTMRKYKSKIAAARKRSMNRKPTLDKLKKRAEKRARNIIRDKIIGTSDKSYDEMSASQKSMIDTKVAKRKAAIKRIAKKLIPKMRSEGLDYDFESLIEDTKVGQDPDIADRKGTQPAVYHKGLSKSTKEKRDAHFKKGAKMDDDNPAAYKPAPGDAEAKTKESKHTKKYKDMFGEELDEASLNDTKTKKRYHEARKKDGTVKIDRRFRAFRSASKPMTEGPNLDAAKKEAEREKESLKREHERELRAARISDASMKKEEIEFDSDLDLINMIEEVANEIHESVELEESKTQAALKKKADKSGMPYGVLKKVYDRGVAAWRTGHRPGTTPAQWGMARVNSFVTKSSGTWGKADKDLASKVRSEEVEISEKLNVSDGIEAWIKDFQDSDAPQFDGKSKEKRREMAIAAFYSAKGETKEEVELDSFFDLNESFDLMEMSIKDKAIAAIHKHVLGGTELSDIAFEVSRAAGVDMTGRELEKAYIAKHGVPKKDTKANAAIRAKLKKKFGYKEECGAGEEGTDKLTKKYKKDTPGENINEDFNTLMEAECQLIGMKQIKEFEKVVDKLFEKFGIDFKFTRHFGERMSDERNTPCITLKELADFIKKIYANQGKSLKGIAGAEAVIKDIQKDLNIPVAVEYDAKNDEFDVVMKTIMRKKNFKTPNKVIKY